jgi:hypothetical protein
MFKLAIAVFPFNFLILQAIRRDAEDHFNFHEDLIITHSLIYIVFMIEATFQKLHVTNSKSSYFKDIKILIKSPIEKSIRLKCMSLMINHAKMLLVIKAVIP